jgi:protein TonB
MPVAFAAAQEPEGLVETTQATSAHQAKKNYTAIEAPVVEALFPGGSEAFGTYLRQRLVNTSFLQANEKKRLVVMFDIDTTGSCTNVAFKEPAGDVFDKEVKRILEAMPRWKPATRNGVPVAITVTLPLTLRGDDITQQQEP